MECTWADFVLNKFPDEQPFARVTLLEDPDTLLADEAIFAQLNERKYRVIEFSTPIALRCVYETYVRPSSDSRLVVIFRNGENIDELVPYDIRHTDVSHRISFSMRKIFPKLEYAVLFELDRKYITELFWHRSETEDRGGGIEDTCEFLFEDMLEMSVTGVKTMDTLFQRLCELHVREGIRTPHLLRYFRDKIRNKVQFRGLSEDGILMSAEKFRNWIRYAWETGFMHRPGGAKPADEAFASQLDFTHPKVRETMQRLFREDWIEMRGDANELDRQYEYLSAGRLRGANLLDLPLQELVGCIPTPDASWKDWVRFAREWAAFTAMKDVRQIPVAKFEDVQELANDRFRSWLEANYAALKSLPPSPPVMVHQIISAMAKKKRDENIRKIALIVMDGMAWNQWVPIRRSLEDDFSLQVGGTFAWVPTLTSISRQAIFSGKIPMDFADSIDTTSKEPVLWKQAWQAEGVNPGKVKYQKGLGLGDPAEIKNKYYTNVEVLGLVIDKIDEMAHGAILGNVGVHQNIQLWLQREYLKKVLHDLVDELGFAVFLTCDHGNLECKGTGPLSQGVLADMKGERVRVYRNDVLRAQGIQQYPGARAWEGGGLPDDCKAMVLYGRASFTDKNGIIVTHGGISIEEVIVPFVRIGKKVHT